MTALCQLFPQLIQHKEIFFFFTKLFNGQSQRAFLICGTKLLQLKITILGGFSHHIFSCFEGNFTQFLSLGEGKMLFLCVCRSAEESHRPSKWSFMTHTYVDHPPKGK